MTVLRVFRSPRPTRPQLDEHALFFLPKQPDSTSPPNSINSQLRLDRTCVATKHRPDLRRCFCLYDHTATQRPSFGFATQKCTVAWSSLTQVRDTSPLQAPKCHTKPLPNLFLATHRPKSARFAHPRPALDARSAGPGDPVAFCKVAQAAPFVRRRAPLGFLG